MTYLHSPLYLIFLQFPQYEHRTLATFTTF